MTERGDRPTVAGRRSPGRLQLVSPATLARAGERIAGRYVIIDVLGHGGHGSVYRAKDELLDRDVALKLVDERRADKQQLAEALTSEARALARLRHPSIVAVHDAGEADGHFFLCMELVPGRTLEEVLDGGAVPVRQAARWLEQLAEALDVAHSHGVIHGDVKPSNVLLDPAGRVHLVDFGIARIQRRASPEPDAISGSPGFTAPEVWRGAPPGPRSDLYSLAATFHALVTGRPPVEGATAEELVRRSVAGAVSPAHAPGVPRGVSRVLEGALAIAPERRPAGARAFARQVRRALRRRVVLPVAAAVAVIVPLLAWGGRAVLAPPLEVSAHLMAERYDVATGRLAPVAVTGGVALHQGDAIWLEDVRVSSDAGVAVYLLDARGALAQLEPAAADEPPVRLDAGVSARLPAELVWRLDDAVGTETLFLAATTRADAATLARAERLAADAAAAASARVAALSAGRDPLRGVSEDEPRSGRAAVEREVAATLRQELGVVEVLRFDHR